MDSRCNRISCRLCDTKFEDLYKLKTHIQNVCGPTSIRQKKGIPYVKKLKVIQNNNKKEPPIRSGHRTDEKQQYKREKIIGPIDERKGIISKPISTIYGRRMQLYAFIKSLAEPTAITPDRIEEKMESTKKGNMLNNNYDLFIRKWFICSLCEQNGLEFSCRTQLGLYLHIDNLHTGGSLKFKICHDFVRVDDVTSYDVIVKHEEISRFYCSVCKVDFRLEEDLTAHDCTNKLKVTRGQTPENKSFDKDDTKPKGNSQINAPPEKMTINSNHAVEDDNKNSSKTHRKENTGYFESFDGIADSINKTTGSTVLRNKCPVFVCLMCVGYSCMNIPDVNRHLLSHKGEDVYKYRAINKVVQFDTLKKEETLVSSSEELRYHCIDCDNHFLSEEDFLVHVVSHGNLTDCSICGKKILERYLHNHIVKHGTGYKFLHCQVCDLRFKNNRAFSTHMISKHTTEKRFECSFCKKRFKVLPYLKKHIKYQHTEHETHICQVCGMNLKSISIKNHMILHSNDKFKCDFCQGNFTQVGSLPSHMRMHFGEYPFPCDICKKWFRQGSQMKRHKMRVHTNERPYLCERCGFSFLEAGSLKHHMTTVHNKLKQYKCENCVRTFGWLSNLRAHMRNGTCRQHSS